MQRNGLSRVKRARRMTRRARVLILVAGKHQMLESLVVLYCRWRVDPTGPLSRPSGCGITCSILVKLVHQSILPYLAVDPNAPVGRKLRVPHGQIDVAVPVHVAQIGSPGIAHRA